MNVIKVTNPIWLNEIVDQVEDFCKKCKIPGIYPQTLATSLQQSIQFGGDKNEVWAAFENNEPVGFIRFMVLGLPYVGSVTSDAIYIKHGNKEASKLLITEYCKFAIRNRSPVVHWTVFSKKLHDHYEKIFNEVADIKDLNINPVIINSSLKIVGMKELEK